MSALMKTLGVILALAGIGVAARLLSVPGSLDAWGIRLDTAALLLIGGVLSLGLGGVMDAVRRIGAHGFPSAVEKAVPAAAPVTVASPAAVITPPPPPANVFGKSTGFAAAAATTAVGAGAAIAAAKPDSVADTISALEQAKADVIKSLGGIEAPITEQHSHSVAEVIEPSVAHADHARVDHAAVEHVHAEAPAVDEGDEADLYVLEEKVIRGRPARILSDATVEAETDEGWMRFENLEHLNEYLDSVEEQSA